MRRALLALLLMLPMAAFAQTDFRRRAGNGDWTEYPNESGCVGGSTCKERRLRVQLEDRPVLAVRFKAHDQIGAKAEGVLRVKIDGNTVEGYLDIPRRGEVFTVDVDELTGRYLVFEPASDDEVEISDIAVLYAPRGGRIIPRDPYDDRGRGRDRWERGGNGGWRAYPRAAACIGGDDCRKNGDRITIALEDAPVLGVRFYAHDAIGDRADGKISVNIDEEMVGWHIDIQRSGKRHELDVDGVYGRKLVIEAANDDEVEVRDIEVLYGRGGRRGGGRDAREVTHEGGCIGGGECGGRWSRIRIPLDGRPVQSIRFYARDDVGSRAGGELRIRIDDEILSHALDIPREGRTFTIDGKGIEGETLIFEPAEDDEVVIRDVRVTFGVD
jgi:hypothetical protein